MLIASCNVNIFMILRSFTIIVECIWCGRSINYLNVYAMYFIGMLLQLHSLHFLAKNRINNAQDYVACNKARVHNIGILFPWCFIFTTWRRTNIFSIILIEIKSLTEVDIVYNIIQAKQRMMHAKMFSYL